MSRMKHLLRKLHIGGGHCEHHPVAAAPIDSAPPAQPVPLPPAAAAAGRVGAGESGSGGGDRAAGEECLDFNFLEEEFQVQLALAISASDPDSRDDPETAQIDAAKRISLGCSTPPTAAAGQALVDILSLHYWSYNVVNYNDKVVDGFYDVYTISSSPLAQGKIPLLVDLQQISVSDDVNYEVILVNCATDFELQRLKQRACAVSTESRVSDHGLIFSGLIQKIADIVVGRMGGPVGDADDMTRKWTARRNELRCLLNTIILPLGHLDFGLSRHRALLFKVLADKINLPCMLVKGSYYTGTDDGAVNLIKVEDGSEYIIDLMGAPGALIPAEVPSSQLPNSFLNLRSLVDVTAMPTGARVVPEGGLEAPSVSMAGGSRVDEASSVPTDDVRRTAEESQIERSENEFGKFLSSPHIFGQTPLVTSAKASSAQKKKVKNVSKYVISAAKDPEFAQKLHAVLLESGASPPPDLFSDISLQEPNEDRFVNTIRIRDQKSAGDGFQQQYDNLFSRQELPQLPNSQGDWSNYGYIDDVPKQAAEGIAHKHNHLSLTSDTSNPFILVANATTEPVQTDAISVATAPFDPSRLNALAATPCQRHLENAYISDDNRFFPDANNFDLGRDSAVSMMETTSGFGLSSDAQSEIINGMLGGDADEWEIPWEDLHIGERIGIGSYGEVYHADWNGTEVAVKKFLNQDFSGEALVQFRGEVTEMYIDQDAYFISLLISCFVEIMLRLRHPNVVLFMGAVTRSPHFSILTEYLPRGSLYRLLHRPSRQLDENRRMKMALDVAKGMNYLHTSHPTIVHRDLKTPNLLVDKNWVVKVCDFGLSRMKHHTFLSSKSTAGTPEWMAPEVLRNEPANEKCDVYSFGVILWEISTSRIPWKGLNPMQVVGAVGFQNRRLEIPEEIDPEVAQIIHDCWLREPNLRPSFSQLMIRIRRLQRLYVEGSMVSTD